MPCAGLYDPVPEWGLGRECPGRSADGTGTDQRSAVLAVFLRGFPFCGENGKRKIRIAALPAGAVALLFLIYSCQPASLFRINRRWDGIHKIAWDLEQAPEAETLRKVEDPGFTVDAYGLRLVFGRELQVEGELTLSAEEPRQEFLFTLDDGYRVKEARAAGGEAEVEMRREGNLLWILTDRAVGELKLFLCYEGITSSATPMPEPPCSRAGCPGIPWRENGRRP